MSMEKRIADHLGLSLPVEMEPTTTKQAIVAEPHEIVHVDNPDLPNISDAEQHLLEAEKQREDMIVAGMDLFMDAFSKVEQIEPKYRGRAYEVLTNFYGQITSAIRDKADLQLKIMKFRMDQANFVSKKSGVIDTGPTKTVTNNVIFAGSREDLREMLAAKKRESGTK